VPPTEAAAQRKGLIRESTQCKNKLAAICDELFPELVRVLKDPNSLTALAIREKFPTPPALATASLSALQATRGGARSVSYTRLLKLQQLAAQSIGTKDLHRQRGLLIEQAQLIKELRLLREHVAQLESEIVSIIEQAHEGQILMSFPGVGPIMAATMVAAMGSIHNFSSAAKLKSYFGWAPVREQTGISFDRMHLTRGGTRTMKQMMFLVVSQAIRLQDNEWARLYERLVKTKCPYDERTRSHVGKLRVIGRIAGQMIEIMYALLKWDAPNDSIRLRVFLFSRSTTWRRAGRCARFHLLRPNKPASHLWQHDHRANQIRNCSQVSHHETTERSGTRR
jgi:transposase